MNKYITQLFEQFIMKSPSRQFTNLIKQQLLELKPIDLTKIYKQLTSSTPLFNQLNLLIAKGVIKYSPSNCTVQLSLPNLLVYQRLFKMAYFAQQELETGVGQFVGEWVEQSLENGVGFPVLFDRKRLEKAFAFNQGESHVNEKQEQQDNKKKSKSKPKHNQSHQQKQKQSKQVHNYNYHKLIYQYKSRDKPTLPTNITINPQIQQPKANNQQPHKKGKPSTQKQSSHKHQQPIVQQQHAPISNIQEFMLNVQELTKLMQAFMFVKEMNGRLGQKEKRMGLFQFLNHQNKQQIMQEIKYQKIQQFLAQTLSPDCLLVFNLVKKHPYITEKQLIKLTMLQVLQTRASLNKLAQKGLLYFYNENARTIVYKVVQMGVLERKYLDTLGRGVANLTLAGEKVAELVGVGHQKVKNKLIQFQCEMQRIDDVMVMFGW